MQAEILTVKTQPFLDQSFGTSGIRKKVATFRQPHYLENILQSVLSVCGAENKTFIVGGDGRYFNNEAIKIAIRMLIAAKAKKIIVGRRGWFSTPAISCYIRKFHLDYAIIFSASHNPAGEFGDFGVKIDGSNGSPINDNMCEQIYRHSQVINEYRILQDFTFDITSLQKFTILDTCIEVVDPVKDYVEFMEYIFDFDKIRSLLSSGFSMQYEAFNAMSGIYAEEIFCNKLGVPLENLQNCSPLPNFGNHHADPNTFYAKHLIDKSLSSNAPDIIFASDGDADRNMIIGKNITVAPSDSLAILLLYAHLIPYYRDPVGVARSMPTSRAVDKVAQFLKIPCYEVPTGWKNFGSLLENQCITFCGEESYGTSSKHCGEKDGIWAMLFWLNIIAETQLSVRAVVEKMWSRFGRYYFLRLDYFHVDHEIKAAIFRNMEKLNNADDHNLSIKLRTFNYIDPINGSITNKGQFLMIDNSSRIIIRASGTDPESSTMRVYLEKYVNTPHLLNTIPQIMLQDLLNIVFTHICKDIRPDIID